MARAFNNLTFGVNIHTAIQPGMDPVTEALHAEQLGFDVVTIHSDTVHRSTPSFELWTLLCWVAAHTSSIQIAPVVLALPHRHPAVVAKMAETLDRLSSGRLIKPALSQGTRGANALFATIQAWETMIPKETNREYWKRCTFQICFTARFESKRWES